MTFRLSPNYRYFGLAGMVVREQGTTDSVMNLEATQNKLTVAPYYWNPVTLMFEVGRQGATAAATAVDATLTSGGSTRSVGRVGQSTPGSSDDYFWVREISTAGGAGSTTVDANLTSAGSTRLVGVVEAQATSAGSTRLFSRMTIDNPTTAVSVANPTTTVDANLSSAGSTRLVGLVGQGAGSTTTDWRVDARRGLTPAFAPIDIATSGDSTIVAADPANKIKVLSYTLVADAAVTARWKSGGSNLSGAMSFAANGGAVAPPAFPAGGHWMETTANGALILSLGGAVGVRGHMSYVLEA